MEPYLNVLRTCADNPSKLASMLVAFATCLLAIPFFAYALWRGACKVIDWFF
jgi:hypothetical protein